MSLKEEVSSGAVIFKKGNETWHVLCIRDLSKNLTFPKGLIEPDEQVKETAIREAQEETGISNLTYVAPLPDVTYFYTRDGMIITKTVHYQLFTYNGQETLKPQIEEGISEIVWLPIEEALTSIGYGPSNKPILQEAKRLISL